MARNSKSKGKGRAEAAGSSVGVTKISAPKIQPKLAELRRVVTSNYAFRCLIENLDAFQSDDYKECAIVKECFGTSHKDVLESLQSREAGERYWQYPDLEDAALGLVGTMNAPMKDGRKGTAMLKAMRPYLLLDKWITVMRKSPADKSQRPVLGPKDLPGFVNQATKAAASKSNAKSEATTNKHRVALRNSHSVTLKMLNLLSPAEQNQSGSTQTTALPMTDEQVWNRLIKYGVNSKLFTKMGTAQYRLATMAVVVNFFVQGIFDDGGIYAKADQLFESQKPSDGSWEKDEWTKMLKDGMRWVNMAAATTLKDALVFPYKDGPSAPFTLEVGMRQRQWPEEPDFVELEKGLWELLFDLALLRTEKSLSEHLSSVGEIAGAERPMKHNLAVVLFTATPAAASSSKRRSDSALSEDALRPAKKPRKEDGDLSDMDVDQAEGDESPSTSEAATPETQLLLEKSGDQHGETPQDASTATEDPSCSLSTTDPDHQERTPPASHNDRQPLNLQGQSQDPEQVGFPGQVQEGFAESQATRAQQDDSVSHSVSPTSPADDGVSSTDPLTQADPDSTMSAEDPPPPPMDDNRSTTTHTALSQPPAQLAPPNDPFAAPDTTSFSPDVSLTQEGGLPGQDSNLSGDMEEQDAVGNANGEGGGVFEPESGGMEEPVANGDPDGEGMGADGHEETSDDQRGLLKGGKAKNQASRYPKRDRQPSNKAQRSEQSGQATNPTIAPKRRQRKKKAKTTKGEEEVETTPKEEEIDYYARLTKNIGYEFVDTEKEVIDVDAWYEGLSEKKIATDTDKAGVPKKTTTKAHEKPEHPDLKSVRPPPNRKTVCITLGDESFKIHTWYAGDFKQLTAFKRRFEEDGVEKEDMVSQMSATDFKKLTAEDLKDILGQKHLLVTGCDSVTSVDDMERRLLMKRVVDIQDLYFRKGTNIASHCRGTLQKMKDIIKSEDADDQQRPMNALDLPCGHIPIEIPRLADMSFRDVVWSYMKHVERPLYQETLPMDDFRWALYSSRNAYSTPHVDSNGLCTAIAPVDCRKLWILGRPLKESLQDSRALAKFRMYDINLQDYEWAPLLIKAGDILYMKPGTVHAVVTIDPGFTIGEHFYTMATLEDSLSSLFHLCAANALLTNASHNVAVVKTIVRLLHCWRYRLCSEVEQDDVPKLEFVNASHVRCLVMIGTYLHVFPYVEDLERGLSPTDVLQLEKAHEDYRFLYNGLVQHFELTDLYCGEFVFPDSKPSSRLGSPDVEPEEEAMEVERGEEGEKDAEEKLYDLVFRNGEMWIIAHLIEFFANARKLVDGDEGEKIDEHAGRLNKLIPELLAKAGLKQAWFDECHLYVKDNFATARLDGWLDWDELTITPKRSSEEGEDVEGEEEEAEAEEQEQEGDVSAEEEEVDHDLMIVRRQSSDDEEAHSSEEEEDVDHE